MNRDDLTLMFIGDIMLGELIENLDRGVKSEINKGVDPFGYVKDKLLQANLVIGNLECVLSLSSDLPEPFSLTLRADPVSAYLLSENNIGLVNLANNHTKDHGNDAFIETLDALSSYGIEYFGYSSNYDFQIDPKIILLDGIKLGFLGYNLANKSNGEIDYLKNRIIDVIVESKNLVDILVLSLHWGLEYVNMPSLPYTALAREFLTAGANIIYGHHSHQLQGIVIENDKIIAFSLGNFIFDDKRAENRLTGILEVNIDVSKKKIKLAKLVPVYINKNFQPMLATDKETQLEKLNRNAVISYNSKDMVSQNIYKKTLLNSRMGHIKNRIRIRLKIISHILYYYKYINNLLRYNAMKE